MYRIYKKTGYISPFIFKSQDYIGFCWSKVSIYIAPTIKVNILRFNSGNNLK